MPISHPKTKEEKAIRQHAYYLKRKLGQLYYSPISVAADLPISPKFDVTNSEIVKLYQELRLTTADQNLRNFRKEHSPEFKALSAIIPNKCSNRTYKQTYYQTYRSHIKAVHDTPEFKRYRKACQNNRKEVKELAEMFYELSKNL